MKNSQLNDSKHLFYITIVASIFILYAFYYDIVLLKYPFSWSYLAIKIGFMIFPVLIAYNNTKREFFYTPLLMALSYSLYSIYYTATITNNYMIASAQVSFVFTSFILLELPHYIILQLLSVLGTWYAIENPTGQFSISGASYALKADYIDNHLSLQLFLNLMYFFTTYPKIKKQKEDFLFVNLGKTSTFLLHEISKPIKRITPDSASFHSDIEQIKETLTIAQALRNNDIKIKEPTNFKLNDLVNAGLDQYRGYIEHLQIKIKNEIPKEAEVYVDLKYFKLVLDNLIKNAIEATIEIEEKEQRLISIQYQDKTLSISNPFMTTVPLSEIFDPIRTTKEGNMGVGLYISNFICQNLSWKLKMATHKKIFTASLSF